MLSGKVLSVDTRNLGEPAIGDAIVGATVLPVADAATFDEAGGLVTINGEYVAYSGIDIDTESLLLTVSLATAVADQDLVEVYPATPIKTAIVSLGDQGGDSVPVTVPHNLLDRLPDGVRDDAASESVTIEKRGNYELVVSDVLGEQLVQQSLDYIPGEEGYGLDESIAQMKDAQVTGQMGAAVVAADQILLAGQDIVDTLAPLPRSTRYASKGLAGNINAGTTSGTTELRLFTFNAGEVKAGRLYYVTVRGLGQGTVAGDAFWIRTRYTEDGSEPTTTSPGLPGGQSITVMSSALRSQVDSAAWYSPTADGVLRLSISAQRTSGTGTFLLRTDTPEVAVQVGVSDMGIDSDSSTALQQTAKTDGSGSDNPPETTKVFTWQPTHTENFSGVSFLNGSSSSSDIGVAEVGWDANNWGPAQSGDRPNFAIMHFNYADIVSKLATASSIVSVQLKFTTKYRASSSGLDMTVFAHKYTSYPWNMALDMSGEISAGRIVLNQGSRNDCVSNGTYTITLNSGVGTNLKSGTYKGLGLTTAVYTAAGVGQIHANPSASRPTLIITVKAPA